MALKPYFITTPIYYINSTPHVGHAYTQIAADARARFERLRGREVYFLTGTDENALKVARAAQAQGRDPLEFCDELAAAFKTVWDKLNISYDDFIRTTEERHKGPVQEVVRRLWQNGHLELGTYSGWYSVPDETFFRPDEVVERDGANYIANPTEDQSKAPLEWVEEVGHFFKLSAFGDQLLGIYDETPEMLRPETRRNETISFIKSGLRDTSISRVQDWGIALPPEVPESEGKVIYVWFPDALWNYASAPGAYSTDPERAEFFQKVWPPDLQLMSKDIFTRFHATLWPALLLSLGLELPRELFAHGFWTVNGRKISKRDPETIVEPIEFATQIAQISNARFEIAVDALRYYSLREVTFGVDGNFSTTGCVERYNSDLANGLGNLLQRATVMLHKYFEGSLPAIPAGASLGIREKLPALLEKVTADYESLNFSGALASIWEIVGDANRLIEEQKPWAKIKEGQTEEVAILLHELFAATKFVAVAIAPVLPTSAEAIWQALGCTEPLSWEAAKSLDFGAGHVTPEPSPIFPRADLKQWEKIVAEKLKKEQAKMSTENTTPPAPAEGATETTTPEVAEPQYITIDDFAKVQLRLGKVFEAERVPKADKLLRLQVDLGTEKRQILAGIAQHYTPEEMVGKQVVVVANLAPRTMRGYESQGMLLAASDSTGKLALVSPIAELEAGATVR